VSFGTSWIFGYGSLIWRPGFRYRARQPGWIQGWSRRLWQRSTDHRGTPDAPGRVATLVPEAGATCGGAAYHIEDADLPSVFDALHVREQQGYELIRIDVRLDDGSTVSAATWLATEDNPYFAGTESVSAIADVVLRSHGPSGSNIEYVLELERALTVLGCPDDHVTAVARLLHGRGTEIGSMSVARAEG
jgi:glutathione-specific gamma-glutamylcyclotransferase